MPSERTLPNTVATFHAAVRRVSQIYTISKRRRATRRPRTGMRYPANAQGSRRDDDLDQVGFATGNAGLDCARDVAGLLDPARRHSHGSRQT